MRYDVVTIVNSWFVLIKKSVRTIKSQLFVWPELKQFSVWKSRNYLKEEVLNFLSNLLVFFLMQLIMQTHEDHFIKTPRRDFHKLGYYRRQLLWQVLENLDPSSAGVWNRTIQA